MANLRKYALETSPVADCENMHSAKIILSPYTAGPRGRAHWAAREKTCTLTPHVAHKVCVIRDNKKPHVKPFVMVLLALRV